MKVRPITTPIIQAQAKLEQVLRSALPQLKEKTVVVLASKLVATCEGRFVAKKTGSRQEKFELVKKEADLYLDPAQSQYDMMLTIKDNWMFVNAGIDESNANNQYLLWPSQPQRRAEEIWQFLRWEYGLKELGVIITDSRSIPLNWGVTAHAIAFCGFEPLKSYIDQPDLFGRKMKMEKLNIMQSLAAAAGAELGEGDESTPLALIEEISHIKFQNRAPSPAEKADLKISIQDDIYAPLLTGVNWKTDK